MGPITGYGTYNGGYGGAVRGSGSSGPKDQKAAAQVKDYATADVYLGGKVDRPLAYATRLRRVTRPQTGGELVKACRGVAVVHHGTPIVVWRRDGLTEFLAYNSVTTKARLNRYLPLSIYSERGRMAVSRWRDDSAPISFRLEHDSWYLVADGVIAGHLDRGSRWSTVEPKPKPIAVDKKGRHGEIIAYRGWRVADDGSLVPLGNATFNTAYESFNLPAARCAQRLSHDVPASGCACGYWSVKEPRYLPTADVVGRVRIWGRYVEHQTGYRSEHMAIDCLVTRDVCLARQVQARYPDVPVHSTLARLTSDEAFEPITERV